MIMSVFRFLLSGSPGSHKDLLFRRQWLTGVPYERRDVIKNQMNASVARRLFFNGN